MSKLSILSEFVEFLRVRKKFWLAPIVFFLLLFGTLIVLQKGQRLLHLFMLFLNFNILKFA